jgi:phosphatidylglycerol lysyltransferase
MEAVLRKRLSPFLVAALFVLALWLLHRELASYTYRDVVRAVAGVSDARFLWSAALTIVAYAVLVGYDAIALSYVDHPLAFRRIAFGSFIAYAFSQTLGFPLFTGNSVRFRLWSSWGMSSGEIARALSFIAFSFCLGLAGVSGVVFLLEPSGTAAAVGFPNAVLRPVGVVCIALVTAYLIWSLRGERVIRLRGWRFTVPSPLMVGAQAGVSALDWVLAGAALYVLLPGGHGLGFLAFLGIFLIAQLAGLVSHVPGGLGVFESIVVLSLKAYLPVSVLLGALITYRTVYYLVPFGIGVVLLALHELRPQAPRMLGVAGSVASWIPRLAPQVLSAAVFLTGAILLVSGETPAVPARMAWLKELLPIGVINVSHFVGSLAGVGLLVLAWALWHRLDAAYGLTVALLSVGIGASLLKGADWEEATALAVVLGAVLPSRPYFYRKSSLAAEPLETGWLLAILLVVAASIWLGVFAHQHWLDRNQEWWRFAFSAGAPRFLRASVGVVAALLVVGLMRLLRHAPARVGLPTKAEMDRAEALIATSSDASANLALVGDKAFLFSESGRGFLMYRVEGRAWVALGDPIGPPADQVELAWRFRELADRHGGWAVFYEVGADYLPLYIDLGLTLLKLGERAQVCLKDFSLDGPSRRALRRTQRQMERDGVTFEVIPPERVPSIIPQLQLVSDAWLREKGTREKRFSLGRFDPTYLARFPVAVAWQHGTIMAFANIWTSPSKLELSVDLMRHTPQAPGGIMQYLFTELILWGQAQEYQYFGLGMAPFSGFEQRNLASLWTRLGNFMYRHGEHFYNFQGLREYKEKFGPVWEPRYLASPNGLALPRILADLAALISGGIRGVVAKGLIGALVFGGISASPAQSQSSGTLGLPLIEVRPTGPAGSTIAVLLSGDGGWAGGDKSMAAALADSGISVVGLDVPSYLRTPRTPDGASADLTQLLEHYLAVWHAERVIVIGYSHGADLAPFMVSRQPPGLRSRIALLALLGLEPRASFRFHMADIIGYVAHEDALPVLPEIEKLRGLPMLCVQGSGDGKSLCSSLPPTLAKVEIRQGGHRISGSEGPEVVSLILREAGSTARPPRS